MSSNRLTISRRSVLGGLMALGVGSAFVGCQPPLPGGGPTTVPVIVSSVPGATLAIFRAPVNQTVVDVAWSPGSRLLAYCTAGDIPDLRICDVPAQKTLLLYQDNTVYDINVLSWLPAGAGQLSYLGRLYGPLQVLEPASGNTLALYDIYDNFAAIGAFLNVFAWSPDGKRVAVSSDDRVFVVDAVRGQLLVTYPTNPPSGGQPSYIVAWSPDGKTIASAGRTHAVQFWEAATGRPLHYFPELAQAIAAAWSPDGRYLAYMVGTNLPENAGELVPVQILVRDVQSGKMALSISGRFPVGSTGGSNQLELVIFPHSLAWSPDSRYLVTAGQGAEVQVWEVAHRLLALSYHGHRDTVLAVAWSPDGRFIASGGEDGTVQVWGAPLR